MFTDNCNLRSSWLAKLGSEGKAFSPGRHNSISPFYASFKYGLQVSWSMVHISQQATIITVAVNDVFIMFLGLVILRDRPDYEGPCISEFTR